MMEKRRHKEMKNWTSAHKKLHKRIMKEFDLSDKAEVESFRWFEQANTMFEVIIEDLDRLDTRKK